MSDSDAPSPARTTGLERQMGLVGLASIGICSMLGAAINVVPFMIQRNVPGIGPYVLPAYAFAALPAILAAMAYAILASAMPRAGGSYIYASRGLSPYLGFVASFSQWFGLSIAIGVVSYVLVPFLRDVAAALEWTATATALDQGPVRVTLSLVFLWSCIAINVLGVRWVARTIVPLMFLMFALGAVVIVAGFSFDQAAFTAAIAEKPASVPITDTAPPPFRLGTFLAAAAILFSSFIGFDSIAQAGGEARNPTRALPRAIAIAVISVGTFYFLFTAAVYHTVPWSYIAQEAQHRDLTAPGLLGALLPTGLTVAIVFGAAIALLNDLPAMLLAVSRLMFAWAEDGVFPRGIARVHPRWRTPHLAIVASGLMATVGVLGSHLAGDFFLGVDILVTSMLVNFLVMCLAVLSLPHRNPALASRIRVFPSRGAQRLVGYVGSALLGLFLVVHIWKDLNAEVEAWYFHSTPVWLGVMTVASVVFWREIRALQATGVDVRARFADLPPE